MWLSLTIYCLLTPLGYEQTAVNTPPPPKQRRSTYYFIYIPLSWGEAIPYRCRLGGGGGLLLLLFLNNFCYSCNENLKGKEEGKKIEKPSAATLGQAEAAGRTKALQGKYGQGSAAPSGHRAPSSPLCGLVMDKSGFSLSSPSPSPTRVRFCSFCPAKRSQWAC